jgi:hypothetical protein
MFHMRQRCRTTTHNFYLPSLAFSRFTNQILAGAVTVSELDRFKQVNTSQEEMFDLAKWWSLNQHIFPTLSSLDRRYLYPCNSIYFRKGFLANATRLHSFAQQHAPAQDLSTEHF